MLRNPRPLVEPVPDPVIGDQAGRQAIPYDSQAFKLWEEGVGSPEKRFILDLGTARASNIAYFSDPPAHLYIADLRQDLPLYIPEMDDEDEGERAGLEQRALAHVLPKIEDDSQHGVLCWDLLNYLTRPQFAHMGQWLAAKLRLDGVIMVSLCTARRMPRAPAIYEIVTQDKLSREQDEATQTDNPCYSQGDFKRYWPDFEVSRSYLMRNERQEFVLRRR